MPGIALRPLGSSGLCVSAVSLGSWRTFDQIPYESALGVMRAARELGITFLDDARYDDRNGSAPTATGYSEVLFGELFREVGWPRSEATVANKLWWEFWPAEDAAAELDGSLARMRFDYVDVLYAAPRPDGMTVDEVVQQVGIVLASGKSRAWGLLNWTARDTVLAAEAAARSGVPAPSALQLRYSLVRRSVVEDDDMTEAVADLNAGIVASSVLEGGLLTGKYAGGTAAEGARHTDLGPDAASTVAAGSAIAELADEWGVAPAALAVAFALRIPAVASVLVGATSPNQLQATVMGAALARELDEDRWERLARIGTSSPDASVS